MMLTNRNVQESAAYLRAMLPAQPEIGLVLGSGLGPLAGEIEGAAHIPYADIPHFRTSTAPDHAGRLVCGTLAGRQVLCMQGRLHGYEGWTPDEVAYPVYVMRALGVRALVLTNASGGINTAFQVGDFMLIEDHINMTGKSPLTGPNDNALGTRFPDMTFAYAPALRDKADEAAKDCGLTLRPDPAARRLLRRERPAVRDPGRDPHVPPAGRGRGRHVDGQRGDRRRALRPARSGHRHDHQHGRGRAHAAALGGGGQRDRHAPRGGFPPPGHGAGRPAVTGAACKKTVKKVLTSCSRCDII